MLRPILIAGLLLAVVAPDTVDAQRRNRHRATPQHRVQWGNPFSFEPFVGFFHDAYDIGDDDSRNTFTAGLKLGYDIGARTRLLGTVGYARSDDVANNAGAANYNVYDNTWILTVAGAEFDVVPGATSASVGLQAGAGWRKTTLDESVGPIPLPANPPSDDGYSAYEVIVPSATLRHAVSRRASLSLTALDYIFDVFEGPAEHSPAVTLGLSIR